MEENVRYRVEVGTGCRLELDRRDELEVRLELRRGAEFEVRTKLEKGAGEKIFTFRCVHH